MLISCNQPASVNPEKWRDKEVDSWFNKGEWRLGWEVSPDKSINRKELAIQFLKNQKRWEKAFSFLKEENLEDLEPGTYELDGNDLYAIVQEYLTKDEKDSRFETHKKYADIQYVISGNEKIGITPLGNTTVTVPYDSINEVTFLSSGSNNYRYASPEKFFVFFPNDAHRPGVKIDYNSTVKKIVVKIKLDLI